MEFWLLMIFRKKMVVVCLDLLSLAAVSLKPFRLRQKHATWRLVAKDLFLFLSSWPKTAVSPPEQKETTTCSCCCASLKLLFYLCSSWRRTTQVRMACSRGAATGFGSARKEAQTEPRLTPRHPCLFVSRTFSPSIVRSRVRSSDRARLRV